MRKWLASPDDDTSVSDRCLFPVSEGEAVSCRRARPEAVEGWRDVGACYRHQQGGPQWCGCQEEEGTRCPGHGLPGVLQCCYDSRVSRVLANPAIVERVDVNAPLRHTALNHQNIQAVLYLLRITVLWLIRKFTAYTSKSIQCCNRMLRGLVHYFSMACRD